MISSRSRRDKTLPQENLPNPLSSSSEDISDQIGSFDSFPDRIRRWAPDGIPRGLGLTVFRQEKSSRGGCGRVRVIGTVMFCPEGAQLLEVSPLPSFSLLTQDQTLLMMKMLARGPYVREEALDGTAPMHTRPSSVQQLSEDHDDEVLEVLGEEDIVPRRLRVKLTKDVDLSLRCLRAAEQPQYLAEQEEYRRRWASGGGRVRSPSSPLLAGSEGSSSCQKEEEEEEGEVAAPAPAPALSPVATSLSSSTEKDESDHRVDLVWVLIGDVGSTSQDRVSETRDYVSRILDVFASHENYKLPVVVLGVGAAEEKKGSVAAALRGLQKQKASDGSVKFKLVLLDRAEVLCSLFCPFSNFLCLTASLVPGSMVRIPPSAGRAKREERLGTPEDMRDLRQLAWELYFEMQMLDDDLWMVSPHERNGLSAEYEQLLEYVDDAVDGWVSKVLGSCRVQASSIRAHRDSLRSSSRSLHVQLDIETKIDETLRECPEGIRILLELIRRRFISTPGLFSRPGLHDVIQVIYSRIGEGVCLAGEDPLCLAGVFQKLLTDHLGPFARSCRVPLMAAYEKLSLRSMKEAIYVHLAVGPFCILRQVLSVLHDVARNEDNNVSAETLGNLFSCLFFRDMPDRSRAFSDEMLQRWMMATKKAREGSKCAEMTAFLIEQTPVLLDEPYASGRERLLQNSSRTSLAISAYYRKLDRLSWTFVCKCLRESHERSGLLSQMYEAHEELGPQIRRLKDQLTGSREGLAARVRELRESTNELSQRCQDQFFEFRCAFQKVRSVASGLRKLERAKSRTTAFLRDQKARLFRGRCSIPDDIVAKFEKSSKMLCRIKAQSLWIVQYLKDDRDVLPDAKRKDWEECLGRHRRLCVDLQEQVDGLKAAVSGRFPAAFGDVIRRTFKEIQLNVHRDVLREHRAFSDPPLKETPAALICPLSGRLMRDPVMLIESGESFERESLLEWFDRQPVSGALLSSKKMNVVSNDALKASIDAFLRRRFHEHFFLRTQKDLLLLPLVEN